MGSRQKSKKEMAEIAKGHSGRIVTRLKYIRENHPDFEKVLEEGHVELSTWMEWEGTDFSHVSSATDKWWHDALLFIGRSGMSETAARMPVEEEKVPPRGRPKGQPRKKNI